MPDVNDDISGDNLWDEYCGFCEFGYGLPEDDCYCAEDCGVIGCQGQKIDLDQWEKIEESA